MFRLLVQALTLSTLLGSSLCTVIERSPSYNLTVRTPSLDFSLSKWIWTPDETSTTVTDGVPPGSSSFRKIWAPPEGKTPVQANVIFGGDNRVALYVNGELAFTNGEWHVASRVCVPLRNGLNVFAAQVDNTGTKVNPAGFIAAIQIVYTDGTTSLIPTDVSWRATNGAPTGFQLLSFDDTPWLPSSQLGNMGIAPWNTIPVAGAAPLSFTNAGWIWTNELVNGDAPQGPRAFRRTITLPNGATSGTANILITADNEFSLYVNGVLAGSGTDWENPQRYVVAVTGPTVVIAVYVYNAGWGSEGTVPSPAGLLVALQIATGTADCSSIAYVVTGHEWKFDTNIPNGFELPSYDDALWPEAVLIGTYGVAPWGSGLVVPSSVSKKTKAISGAPAGVSAV